LGGFQVQVNYTFFVWLSWTAY